MSKPAGKCVFCGGTGLTKGHVWPDWLSKILPVTATRHEFGTGEFQTFTPEEKIIVAPKSLKTKQGHARARKPRNTCLNCNTGWMSVIENHAMPFAVPLIQNAPSLLGTAGQCAVATLLCLITMRVEFLGNMRAIPQSDRDWLRLRRCPSANWKIWIARYSGDNPDQHWSRYCAMQIGWSEYGVDLAPTDQIGAAYCNTQVTTLVIGQLCAHLFCSTVWPEFAGYEGIRLTQIWPMPVCAIDTRWLPPVDDKAVLWLHEALPRASAPVPGR